MYNKYVGILTFNKLDTLKKTISSIENCYDINNYSLVICVDSVEKISYNANILEYSECNKSILNFLHTYENKNLYKSFNIIEPNVNLGPESSCKFLMDYIFTKTNFGIYLEDDILLCKDALVFYEKANKEYPECCAYCASSIFKNSIINNNNANQYLNNVHKIDWISSTDFAITKSVWDKYGHIRGDKYNGDVKFGYLIRENKYYTICPMISRCKRIGINHKQGYSTAKKCEDFVESYFDFNSDLFELKYDDIKP